MKKIYFLIVYLIYSSFTFSQVPSWNWESTGGGADDDRAFDICSDKNGDIIVAGYFRSSSATFGSQILTGNGGADLFIVKYDSSGNVKWAVSFGGNEEDAVSGVCSDSSGNIYVVGNFESDSMIVGNTVLYNNGQFSDIYIAKMDSSGNILWAESAAGDHYDAISGICIDKQGNILIAGWFQSTVIDFGSVALINSGVPFTNIFISKYDSAGNLLWAKSTPGSPNAQIFGIATDTTGDFFIAGGYFGTLQIGSFTFVNPTFSMWEMFTAKFDSFGNVIWARSDGAAYNEVPVNVAIDKSGNFYVAGWFDGLSVPFDNDTIYNVNWYIDGFIVKYDTYGNVLWAKSGGGTHDDYFMDLTTNSNGDVLLTGNFNTPTFQMDSLMLNNSNVQPSEDIYILKLDSSGNIIYGITGGGMMGEVSYGITTHGPDNVTIAGTSLSNPVVFGPHSSTNFGSSDVFTAHIGPGGITGLSENVDNPYLIYPNPSNGIINLKSLKRICQLCIRNTAGQLIYKDQSCANDFFLKLDEPGVYYFQFYTENTWHNEKVIILD